MLTVKTQLKNSFDLIDETITSALEVSFQSEVVNDEVYSSVSIVDYKGNTSYVALEEGVTIYVENLGGKTCQVYRDKKQL